MKYACEIKNYFAEHREDFLHDLSELVAIDSQKGEPLADAPFGKGPALALEKYLSLAKGYGLHGENWDHYLGIVELSPDRERNLDILVHLDVVPSGGSWTVTEPFIMKEIGDRVYGRGCMDDKGPALAALYALRAIRELEIPLSGNVRIMAGCDEECGSSELKVYFDRCNPAQMTFSPDAVFPIITAEKARAEIEIFTEFNPEAASSSVLWLKCGDKINMIPALAEACVRKEGFLDMESACGTVEQRLGVQILCEEAGENCMRIQVKGKGGHTADPDKCRNAATAMLELLHEAASESKKDSVCGKLRALRRYFPHGAYCGKHAGLYLKDDISGETLANLTCLNYEKGRLSAAVDARLPVCAERTDLNLFQQYFEEEGFLLKIKYIPPHSVDADSYFVRSLKRCYEAYTGKKGFCISASGGTYVHGITNGVAFGCMDPETDYHIHGADEFAITDELLLSGAIFTQSIYELCGNAEAKRK